MKQDSRHSYVRLLGKLIGLVGRGAPLPLLAMVAVSLAVMGANVLVFHLLEAVLSQLAAPERLSEIAGAILVAGSRDPDPGAPRDGWRIRLRLTSLGKPAQC